MFLHIGDSHIVFNRELIGIFNIDADDESTNQNFLKYWNNITLNISSRADRPKSFIITDQLIYISPISPLTLAKRQKSKR
ncbi:MAG: DUF370 domain-containing protein [Bacillota bacterium]|nr:DUF370 domain-containing protein [Bacillota bacterium]